MLNKLFLALMFLPFIAFAKDITPTLEWDPNIETDLVGYRLYWSKTSGNYTVDSMVEVLKDFTEAKTIPLEQHTKYFFVVVAYNEYGESEYSNEITYTTPGKPGKPLNLRLKLGTDGKPVLSVDGDPGSKFTIQTSTDLQTWSAVAQYTIPDDGVLEIEDESLAPRKFYKIEDVL